MTLEEFKSLRKGDIIITHNSIEYTFDCIEGYWVFLYLHNSYGYSYKAVLGFPYVLKYCKIKSAISIF